MINRTLILAGDTDGNLGDFAILAATCGALRKANPAMHISVIAGPDSNVPDNLNVNRIRKGPYGLLDLAKCARRADLILFGGGGLLQDDDSLLKTPYWAAKLGFVRLIGGEIDGLSVGAGPLYFRFSRFFTWLALLSLRSISVRDELALDTIAGLTSKPVRIVPDPAFLLQPTEDAVARAAMSSIGIPIDGTPLIGVALRRWFHKNSSLIPYMYASKLGLQKNRGKKEMAALVAHVAYALDKVIEKTGSHVVFMPTYNVAHEADMDVCNRVADAMRHKNHSFLILDDPAVYKSVTRHLAVMVCGRMHSAIMAAGSNTPVIGLAYNQKFHGTFSLLGISGKWLPIDDVAAGENAEETTKLILMAMSEEAIRPDTRDLAMLAESHIQCLVRDPEALQAVPGSSSA